MDNSVMICHKQDHGFTLVELLVTLAIAAIMASIAAPNLNASIQSMRVQTLGEDLLMTLQRARSESLRLGSRVTVCASVDAATCATSGTWSSGWITFNDLNANASIDTGERILAIDVANRHSLQVLSSTSLGLYVSFVSSGRTASNNGDPLTGVIRVCNPSPSVSDDRRPRHLPVGSTGRTTWTPSSSSVSVTCPAP